MSEVKYYQYDVDAPIQQLVKKFVAILSNEIREKSSHIETACVLLAPYVKQLPTDVAERVRDAAAAVKTADGAWLNHRLREACSDQTGWVSIESEAAVNNYFETIAERDIINTVQFLGLLRYRLVSRPETKVPESARRGAKRLLSKFEVFGRIFTLYTNEFRKATETYDILLDYGLLSLVFLGIYDRFDEPDFLNAALKVNDMLVATMSYLTAPVETFVTMASLCYGKSQVENFYDSRGFRLPPDQ